MLRVSSANLARLFDSAIEATALLANPKASLAGIGATAGAFAGVWYWGWMEEFAVRVDWRVSLGHG
jgi:hypothetical protein